MSDDLRDFFSEISKSKKEKKKKLEEAKDELKSIVGDLGLDSLFKDFGNIKKEQVEKEKEQSKKLEAFETFFSNIEKPKPKKVIEEPIEKEIIEEPTIAEEQEIQEISEDELEKEIEEVREEASLVEKSLGLLAITDDNKDPLTPLNQEFSNFEEFQKHYSTLIQRIQQQLSTLGGGGEVNFKYLDDVTWNGSDDNGKFLKYNSTTEKFEFATVSGGSGGGSIAGIDTTGTSFFNNLNVTGITTIGNVVVGGASTELVVNGDARVTGILTIGQSSLKLDGTNNIVNVGTALTLGHTNGIQFHTQNLHASGFEVNNINASGIITASSFRGDGSQLTGISGGGGGISNIGIQSAGTLVGTATTLNFASEFNPTVSNNIATVSIGSSIRFVGANVYFLNMVPGATNVYTAVDQNDIDGVNLDTNSFYNSTNGRFVIPPGVSKVRFTLTLSKSSGAVNNAWTVFKNGSLLNTASGGFQNEYETTGFNNAGGGAISAVVSCQEDDYFQLYYYISANTSNWTGSFEIEVIEGSLLGHHFASTNVTNADNITVQANNSTDETVYPIFVDGATGLQSPESDTGLMYNPSTGTLTSSVFSGIVTTAAQPNITSLGTLSSVTVSGNIIANGDIQGDNVTNIGGINVLTATTLIGEINDEAQTNITSVGTLDSLSVSGDVSIGATQGGGGGGGLSVVGISTLGVTSTTDLTTQQLNVSGIITATNRLDVKSDDSTSGRIHFYCESSNAHYLNLQAPPHSDFSGNPTVLLPNSAGTLLLANGNGVNLSGIVTSIVAGDNVTISGATGEVTVGVTTEQVQDIVGAMFSGNTETNISATYQDDDGTIDLVASGGGGSGGVTVQDEGSALSTTGTTLNFVGSGVVASGTGATKTITIAGGGSGGGSPGGSNTQIQYNNSSSFGGVANLTFDGSALGFSGMVKEGVNIVANKLSAATDIDVEDGHVHMFTTNETADATPNIRYNSSAALNTKMSIGDVITLTIIAAVNNINYTYDEVTIDGGAQTELWLGGSAPQAGGTGNDVYTYTIIKTADATFTVMINVVNFTA